jgi:hypothetical protein
MIQSDAGEFLISCCNQQGGLYKLTLSEKKYEAKKVLNFECRGIAKYGQNLLVASNSEGLFLLDKELKIIKQKSVNPQLDLHGAVVKGDYAFIVETGTNSIGVYDLDKLDKVDEFSFSPFKDRDICHVNDLCLYDDRLLVSMFYYPDDKAADGAIVEVSLKERKVSAALYNSLKQPHSVVIQDSDVYYCISEGFQVFRNDKPIFKGMGYTRGLAVFNNTMIIGQSKTRNLTNLLKTHQNILYDCGVYIFNMDTRLTTFIPIPSEEIYGVLPIT